LICAQVKPWRHQPDLQSSCTQNTGSLILGHVRGCRALVIGNLLGSCLLDDLARIPCVWVARNHNAISVYGRRIRAVFVSIGATLAFNVFRVEEIFGLIILKVLLGLVVVAVVETMLEHSDFLSD
jgi:hypothetical protein